LNLFCRPSRSEIKLRNNAIFNTGIYSSKQYQFCAYEILVPGSCPSGAVTQGQISLKRPPTVSNTNSNTINLSSARLARFPASKATEVVSGPIATLLVEVRPRTLWRFTVRYRRLQQVVSSQRWGENEPRVASFR
jgi:hypothetical protein